MIKITVNGEPREIEEGTTVDQLIEMEGIEMPESVSIFVNEEFALRGEFGPQYLEDGDEVEYLYFTING